MGEEMGREGKVRGREREGQSRKISENCIFHNLPNIK